MLNNIFDSHAHYQDEKFDDDRHELLAELPNKGIRGIMTAGSNIPDSQKAQDLARRYPFVFFAAGVHPHDAKDATPELETQLIEFAKDPKMKAIGEIGLDYYYDYSPRELQKEVFERQIILAKQLDLPIIIHDREAHQDTYDILAKHRPKGVVHSYSGSAEMVKDFLDLGLYIGFTGVITFKNARKPLEAVAEVPLNRLVVETDCPYLAPVPYRGKRSDSSMITSTIAKMAEIKGNTPQEMLDITFENTCRLFEIDPETF